MNHHLYPSWDELNNQLVSCSLCPRLIAWSQEVARIKRRAFRDWNYWGKPVPGFGDKKGRILVIGLAPGAHGSNRTGRMFTGDSSGDFLYAALHKNGFANQAEAFSRDDGLELNDIFITAVCRCAPPENKPLPEEIINCQPYLLSEINLLPTVDGIIALGNVAYQQIQRIFPIFGWQAPKLPFSHGGETISMNGSPWVITSYHPSRQNTQTGRLTVGMFNDIWIRAKEKLNQVE